MKNFEIRKSLTNYNSTTKYNESLWKRKVNADISVNYDIAIKSTKESRLRLLHFKILHNIYPTNILLNKMKIKSSMVCEHCHVPDYIEHFFYDCALVFDFWKYIINYIKSEVSIDFIPSRKDILIGLAYSEFPNIKRGVISYINHIILIGKLCISKLRYGQINNIFKYSK